jgi:hypothetical protein
MTQVRLPGSVWVACRSGADPGRVLGIRHYFPCDRGGGFQPPFVFVSGMIWKMKHRCKFTLLPLAGMLAISIGCSTVGQNESASVPTRPENMSEEEKDARLMYVGAVIAMDAIFGRSDDISEATHEKTDVCLPCDALIGLADLASGNETWPPRYTEGNGGPGLLLFLIDLTDSWTRSAAAAIAYQNAFDSGDLQQVHRVLAAAMLSFDAPEFFLPQTEFLFLCALGEKVDEQVMRDISDSPLLGDHRELMEDRIEWYTRLLMLAESNKAD